MDPVPIKPSCWTETLSGLKLINFDLIYYFRVDFSECYIRFLVLMSHELETWHFCSSFPL